MSGAPEQLLVFEFGPGVAFEGHLVGALERLESGGALAVRAVLFVQRDRETGDPVALERHGGTSGTLTASLLDFRLDAGARRRETTRALQGEKGDTVRAIAERVEPGGAVAAVVVEHRWAEVLADAAQRAGATGRSDDMDLLARGLLA